MEASGSEASTGSRRREAGGPSGPGRDGPKAKKRPANAKAKKPKRARVSRPAYTVHQGEDMLLVVHNAASQYEGSAWTPKKKKKGKLKANQVKKKKTTGVKRKVENKAVKEEEVDTKPPARRREADPRWGEHLPEELLVSIFQMVVLQDGAVPFLCRVGSVCRLWNAAASSPALWRSVTVGFCWIGPGKTQLPKTEQKIRDTVTWLAENRFSQLRDFSLCHWSKNVDFAIEVVSRCCPQLGSIKLSYCSGLTAKSFLALGQHSRCLHSINVQYSEFQVNCLLDYLMHHGHQIRQILFTHGPKNDRLLAAIAKGLCPDLEMLEVNTKLDSKQCELPVYIQALQKACPKLKSFRMLNVTPLHKTMRHGADSASGFPLLEELCLATTSFSYMTDKDLKDALFGSPKLRVLDLRGCWRVTPAGLAALPCLELECLFLGQYFNIYSGLWTLKTGLHLVTQKWCQTLQQLDLANQLFTEEDMELALSHLSQAAKADTLRSLNLSGTRVTPRALRAVVGRMTALDYLNLSSCRNLPRGAKKIYRGQEEIRQLLDVLD